MAYDFKKHLAVKGRVPKEQPLFLSACCFAAALLGKDNITDEDTPQLTRMATELLRVAEFYSDNCCVAQALMPKRAGRPRHLADIGFIYAMTRFWESTFGLRPKFRWYQNARIKKHEKGGAERPTDFQVVCKKWMEFVDPDRPSPLSAAAFKNARKLYKRRAAP